MARDRSRCRWCGALLAVSDDAQGRGRKKVWCGAGCSRSFQSAFGGSDWSGPVRVEARCTVRGCRWSDVHEVGAMLFPAAHAEAAEMIESALHGHAVKVTVRASFPEDRAPRRVDTPLSNFRLEG